MKWLERASFCTALFDCGIDVEIARFYRRDGGVDANQGWAQTEPRGAYGANAGKGGKVAQASGDRSNKFLPCLPVFTFP